MLHLFAQSPVPGIDPSQIVEAVNKGPIYVMSCVILGLGYFTYWIVKRFDAKEERQIERNEKSSDRYVTSMEKISSDHREFGKLVTEKLSTLGTSVDSLAMNVTQRLDRVETRVEHVEDAVKSK